MTISVGYGPKDAAFPTEIRSVDLEQYVRGVVAGELAIWSAPPALIEAQAIAARSYALCALKRREPDEFLWHDTRDQMFRPLEPGALPEHIRVTFDRALARSRGKVLLARGRILDARFHAACGGTTSSLEAVFGDESDARIDSVSCPACRAQKRLELRGAFEATAVFPVLTWETTFSRATLDELAHEFQLGERLLSLRPTRIDAHDRWMQVVLVGPDGEHRLSINELRAHLRDPALRSGRVLELAPSDGHVREAGLSFRGLGHGHGVGFCQHGARRLAEAGWSAERLLEHYYPGSRIEHLRQ